MPLQALLLRDPSTPVAARDERRHDQLRPATSAGDAAKAFERYDLVSAPVVDDRGKLVGRLTVDAVMDVLRDESNLRALQARRPERGRGSVCRARGTARATAGRGSASTSSPRSSPHASSASSKSAIQQLAALAALMPIVASIGGNTGNQTMALVIRALAVDQIQPRRRAAAAAQGAGRQPAERRACGACSSGSSRSRSTRTSRSGW